MRVPSQHQQLWSLAVPLRTVFSAQSSEGVAPHNFIRIFLEEMEGFLIAGFILVCFGQNFVFASSELVYSGAGKSLTLRPPKDTATITSILWRHKGNLAAEWTNGHPDIFDFYGSFKNRATLNPTTGVLEIRDMTENEAGVYTVEINNDLKPNQYEAKLIEEVPEPKVWVRPGATEDQRELFCDGNTAKAGPVTFWWDVRGDEKWLQFDQRLTIHNNETTQEVKEFFCKMMNPIGEKESGPAANPFYKKEQDNTGKIVAPVLTVLILVIVGVVAYFKRAYIKQRFCAGGEPTANTAVSPKSDEESGTPLKDKTEDGS